VEEDPRVPALAGADRTGEVIADFRLKANRSA
jgi:hypothetical protein